MKKMTIKVVKQGEVIHFVNNGQVSGAPMGATIAARTKAANTTVSPSGIVSTYLNVETKSPKGQMINLRINDSQIINQPAMVDLEIPALYELGEFDHKGQIIEGYVEKVTISNAYSPFNNVTLMVVTEEGRSFDNCKVIEENPTVWGLV
jgi:hypothetical protein